MSNISRFQFEQMQSRVANRRGEPVAPPPTEKKLHQEIMDYCDAQWPRWKYIHSRMDKPTRNEAGVPDFVIFLPRRVVVIVEAKRPGEKVRPAQRDWHAEVFRLEFVVHVVHDLTEFIAAVKIQTNNQQKKEQNEKQNQ